MRKELVNIRQSAETLLRDYKKFAKTLSPFNPFSRFSFAEKQPLFETKLRALMNSYSNLSNTDYSAEEQQEYEQLHDLLLELKNEIF